MGGRESYARAGAAIKLERAAGMGKEERIKKR